MITGKPHQVAIKSIFAIFGIYPANLRRYQKLVQFEKKWSSWIIKNKLASPPPTEAKHLVLERYHIQDAVWLGLLDEEYRRVALPRMRALIAAGRSHATASAHGQGEEHAGH